MVVSQEAAVPMVAGMFRHRIVVPVQWQEWSRFKRRSVVAHEAAHIRRGDVELALLRKVMLCVYWFHPIAWWLDRESAQCAEYAADDAASARVGDRVRYSRVLVEVASEARSQRSIPLLAMARPSTILVRIARLLTESGSMPAPRRLWLAVPTMYVFCAFIAAAFPVLPGARAGSGISLGMFFQRQMTGKLGAELVVNPTGGQAEELSEAPPDVRSRLPERLDASDALWQGWISVPPERKLTLLVLEPAAKDSRPALYADLNFDGRFSAAERFEFRETVDDPGASGDVLLHIPLSGQPFPTYPVRLRLPRRGNEPFGSKALVRSPFAYVSGTVNIGGKPVLVWVQYDPKRGGAFPDYGWQGMDVNQDGRIQSGANSPEYTFAKDERVIFSVAGNDVSITNVDFASRTITFREHPSGSNQRILLHKGAVVPDFTFRDLAGQEHKLSDFRGRYVLLDFWGTWCPPCIRLLPELQRVHEQFRGRGLVVLGLPSHEESPDAPRSVLAKHGVTFLQAEPESVSVMVNKQFRINMFPTHILIDGEGRIVEDGEAPRPPQLIPLLDRMLPKE